MQSKNPSASEPVASTLDAARAPYTDPRRNSSIG